MCPSAVSLTIPIWCRCVKIRATITLMMITAPAAIVSQHFAFVVLFQMLSYLCMAMLIICNNDFTSISGCDACFTIELSRQIALPIFFILANILDAKRMTIVH